MSINFTDKELKSLSKDVISGQETIVNLNELKGTQEDLSQQALEKDQANSQLFNYYLSVITQYHSELRFLVGEQRTTYDPSNLETAARRLASSQHFPILAGWVNFQPKVLDSNNGLPITNLPDHERPQIDQLEIQLNLLLNGFSDGSADTLVELAYTGGATVEVASTAGFSIGNRVVIYNTTGTAVSYLAIVTGILGGPPRLQITLITPVSGTVTTSGRVRNFINGFTNAERSGGVTPEPEVLQHFKNLVAPRITLWKNYLTPQKTALTANQTFDEGKEDLIRSRGNVDSTLLVIQNYENELEPTKYSDAILNPILSEISERKKEIPARAASIRSFLGAANQAPTGAFSGSGKYFDLFKWIDLRVGIQGSLTRYYSSLFPIGFSNSQISTEENRVSDLSKNFIVRVASSNPIGNIIPMASVDGIFAGDTVKLMDDDLPVKVLTVQAVNPESLVVDQDCTGYLVEKAARVVKQF